MSTPVSAKKIDWRAAHDAQEAKGEQLRCCAVGCGDKIKQNASDPVLYEIVWSDGSISYLEDDCLEWFVNGHPDYGGARGPVDGLPGCGSTFVQGDGALVPVCFRTSEQMRVSEEAFQKVERDSQAAIASLLMGRLNLL